MNITKTYPSKIDTWLVVLLAAIFLPLMALPFFTGDWMTMFFMVPLTAFIIHMFLNTYYTIAGEILTVKSGFVVNLAVDIMAIRKIEETNNVISSPATSLDRLEIIYNKFDSVIISPENKAGFIADILAINPNAEVKYKN
ncbi:PH domain-containing protein [Mucilaginibacter auburnensis]|uniref:PH (Pleckstrin Homology) domain-containing protein n=1 Tax=Mucilaginibacter auburnensis TaxID=1457233 RepID=A0A2H9VPZ9_9SPHI|nr:PH domain-containing protein [Mucilaginibacter auburnensis]PJJ80414.1 PH (Pleckstrin Homology) domain-containing protein [Mucilaginibacter auburnensis]